MGVAAGSGWVAAESLVVSEFARPGSCVWNSSVDGTPMRACVRFDYMHFGVGSFKQGK